MLPLLGEITLADADMPIYHASAVGLSAEAADALARAQTAGECYALNPGSIAQNLLRNGYAREDISLTNVFAVPMEYMADFDAADTLSPFTSRQILHQRTRKPSSACSTSITRPASNTASCR